MEKPSRARGFRRALNACSRCRKQKIKCSGLQPCEKCVRRREQCTFDDLTTKITVTRGYLEALVRKAEQDGASSDGQARESVSQIESAIEVQSPEKETAGVQSKPLTPSTHSTTEKDPELSNPLVTTPSRYNSSPNGKPFYLGAGSSNWSFCRRALSILFEHVRRASLPTDGLLFDGLAYDDDFRTQQSRTFDSASIPCLDQATYLISVVKFRCCQLLHFFSEDEFSANMRKFYIELELGHFNESGLWYVQFMLLLAFGKSLVQRTMRTLSGLPFFVRAVQLLPDVVTLCREPILSSEILCCMAWFYQALDFRHAAHSLIVQAKSVAMNHGMHNDMSVSDLGEQVVHRCRQIWWTISVLDGQMTYLMGLPQQARNEGVSCQVPSSIPTRGSAQRIAACAMQIKLTQIVAETNTAIYGAKGRLNKDFVVSTQCALNDIAKIADELKHSFPLHLDGKFNVSRAVAQLHLLYHQCVVLATRPLMLCCLIKKIDAPAEGESLASFPKLRNLLRMCVDSSQQMIAILDCLYTQDQLESFLPLDLDPLFVSIFSLLISHTFKPPLVENQSEWLTKSFVILDEMIHSGNRIAVFRKKEVELLRNLLEELEEEEHNGKVVSWPQFGTADVPSKTVGPVGSGPMDVSISCYLDQSEPNSSLSHANLGFDGCLLEDSQGDELTAEYIMSMANSLDYREIGWLHTTDMYPLE